MSYLSVREVAVRTGWSRNTVLQRLRDGSLRGYRTGPRGRWLVSEESLLEALARFSK